MNASELTELANTVPLADNHCHGVVGTPVTLREGVASFLEKRPPTFPGKVSSDMPSQYPWWAEN
jgi:hypothetical protein